MYVDDKEAVPIRFIDSLQFLLSSLANLGSMLQPGEKKFVSSLRNLPDEARTGKGIFPYSFISSQQVLEEVREMLPSCEETFNYMLSDSVSVIEINFQRAQLVWSLCGCQSLKDYMLLCI